MINIAINLIEDAIIKELEELKRLPSIGVDAEIEKDSKPGGIGIRSQVLVTVMGNLEEILGIEIPNNCYIFRDTDGIRELTVREASEKLQKIAKHAKQ